MGSVTRRLSTKARELIPPNSWDSHMHIFDPDALPPSSKPRAYTPPSATIQQAKDAIGFVTPKMCIVQPSVLGTDNAVTMGGVKDLGLDKACAVVELDAEKTTKEMMESLHAAGARGVRANFVSRGLDPDPKELEVEMRKYADLIKPYGWVLQMYIPLRVMDGIGGFINDLGVPVCLDHFVQPKLKPDTPLDLDPTTLPGFNSLLKALSAPSSQLYIKISGQYRLLPDSPSQTYKPLRTMFFHYLDVAPDRLVYASDWPHTRFEGIDTNGWADRVVEWCEKYVAERKGLEGEEKERESRTLVEGLFRDNAERLWFGRSGRQT